MRASTAGLLLASEPVWVLLAAGALMRERLRREALTGTGVSLAGVAVLSGPGALSAGPGAVEGSLLVIAAAIAFGVYAVVLAPLSAKVGATTATAVSTVTGTLIYLACLGWRSDASLGAVSGAGWVELAFLALGSSVAGMVLFNRALSTLGAARAAGLLYLIPLISVIAALAALGEQLTPTMTAGGALVLIGIIATQRRPTRRNTRARPHPHTTNRRTEEHRCSSDN